VFLNPTTLSQVHTLTAPIILSPGQSCPRMAHGLMQCIFGRNMSNPPIMPLKVNMPKVGALRFAPISLTKWFPPWDFPLPEVVFFIHTKYLAVLLILLSTPHIQSINQFC
jgi:hypothetical protein